jgi:hypothetical protein
MDHVRIFKELHSLACLLEDNGKFIESSKITNVMTRIAQTAPAGIGNTPNGTGNPTPGNPPAGSAGTGTTQFTPEQIKENIKNRFLDMLKLRSLAEAYQTKYNEYPEYFISADNQYVVKGTRGTAYGKTLEQVANQIGTPIANVDNEKTKIAEDIAQKVLSAKSWPNPQGDASITNKINEEYELGYNLLAGTFYIGHKTNKNDVVDKKDINDLKAVFLKLGEHYKKYNNQFPEYIFQALGKNDPDQDPNKIILDAFKKDVGEQLKYIKTFANHPNYKDIKRGFVQEHNRRRPASLIRENIFNSEFYKNL